MSFPLDIDGDRMRLFHVERSRVCCCRVIVRMGLAHIGCDLQTANDDNLWFGNNEGQFTDHKNLTYNNFNMECVMRWRLLIEEFGPTIEYIKGPKNIVVDALSRLNLVTLPSDLQDMADCYGLDKDDLPSDAFPITYQLINHEQNKDKTLLATAKGAKHYTLKEFHGGDRSPQLL